MQFTVNRNCDTIKSMIGQYASPFIGLFIDCVLGFILCICCFVFAFKRSALNSALLTLPNSVSNTNVKDGM